ncbi:right-handed parallel beta-helix repeat-containing protein [Metabacillus sp. Hm71]|uniref:right-handed parallel beta-helix repeat-containing protein n=1 Tax=Metabacillus sp. Hm71 TaxID=3450743 RepID=UPI003F438643
MINYLKMNGLDSSLKTPSITANEYIFDIELEDRKTNAVESLFDHNYQWLRRSSTEDYWSPGIVSVYVNGEEVLSKSQFLNPNKRLTVRIFSTSLTGIIHIFRNWNNSYFTEGKIYDIKILNNGEVIAHYDMSTQTVEDQSGNGNHATLIGGEWLQEEQGVPEDNTGGETETYNNSIAYVVELEKWGIAKGIPPKPYKDTDYIKADNNIQGINNAIQYAYENGYTEVVLPRGKYSLCYPREILINQDNMTLNLNGSTLKVIYDSDRKSPFDTRTTTDYYNFIGNSIVLSGVRGSHVINGTLIGCRDDRSFINVSEERKQEHTYGIVFTKGTNHSSVKNCTVRDYMGDNISFSSTSFQDYAEFALGLTAESLDVSTGQPTLSTNSVTSQMIPIQPNYTSFLIAGAGYGRQTAINSREVGIFYYDKNNVFIRALPNRKIYTPLTIPVGATGFRIVFYGETNTNKNMSIVLKWGLSPHHNIVEHNEVFNGHRGGITLGGSYNIIQNNSIHDNGWNFIDGKPVFNDPTRYGINQEDSYGDNCIIRNNTIYNTNHGVLLGCYSVEVYDNYFYNNLGIAINLYSLLAAKVRGNFIYNCTNSFGLMTAHLQNANVIFSENTVVNSPVNTVHTGIGYDLKMINNTFIDTTITMPTEEWYVFKDNTIKLSNYKTDSINLTIGRIENCIFEAKGNRRKIGIKGYEAKDCKFTNVTLSVSTPKGSIENEKYEFKDCKFINSEIESYIFNPKSRNVAIYNSELVDTRLKVGNINVDNEVQSLSVHNSKLTVKSIDHLVFEEVNKGHGTGDFINCNIEISNPSFSKLINGVYGTLIATFKECEFKYTGSGTLNLQYHGGINKINKFISANNVFTNINLPAPDSKFIGYDPEMSSYGSPTSIPRKVGQEYFDLTNKKLYKAFGNTSVTDWVAMN